MGILNSVDLLVVAVYLVGITIVGSLFYRRHTNTEEYLLGGKGVNWLVAAMSILAADTSAITYLGLPAWSFSHDLKMLVAGVTVILAVPIVVRFFLPIYSKGGIYTAYQYLEQRFDIRVRILASVFFLLIRGAHVAVIIYAPALMMAELMQVPLLYSVLGMAVLTGVYTSLGGIKAVVWTDSIQVITVMIGFTAVAASALAAVPGGLGEVLRSAGDKLVFYDFTWQPNTIDNSWLLLICYTLLNVQAMSTDQAVLQKYLTTRSSKETTKSLLLYGISSIPLFLLLCFLGVILHVFYAQHPEVRASLKNSDAVVAHFAATQLRPGLAGLVVASIFAGSMSTVSASLNSLATSTVIDFYQRIFRPGLEDRHYAVASRWATIGWTVLATVGALYAGKLGALIFAFTKIQGVMGGVILGIFLSGIVIRRATSRGVLVAAALGLAAVLSVSLLTQTAMNWYVVIGCGGTMAAAWGLTLAVRGHESDIRPISR